jgi:hypothetical protein
MRNDLLPLMCLHREPIRSGPVWRMDPQIMIHRLVERERGAGAYVLTDEGRAVLTALLSGADGHVFCCGSRDRLSPRPPTIQPQGAHMSGGERAEAPLI